MPNLAIHLYREINQEGLKLNAQRHMVPVLGLSQEAELVDLLVEELGRDGAIPTRDALLGFDLMTYDVQPSAVSGAGGEFIHAPRLDNLASSHAALAALERASADAASEATRVVVLYDHEEVGSRSAQGAAGSFLEDTLARVAAATSKGGADARARAASRSWLISADMAHAVHPNYADRHEPGHRPKLGAGPVIKANANQAYATDAESAGLFSDLCARVGVAPQHFVTRSDLGCGSTIGPISAAPRRDPDRRRRQPDALDALVPRDGRERRRLADDRRARRSCSEGVRRPALPRPDQSGAPVAPGLAAPSGRQADRIARPIDLELEDRLRALEDRQHRRVHDIAADRVLLGVAPAAVHHLTLPGSPTTATSHASSLAWAASGPAARSSSSKARAAA